MDAHSDYRVLYYMGRVSVDKVSATFGAPQGNVSAYRYISVGY